MNRPVDLRITQRLDRQPELGHPLLFDGQTLPPRRSQAEEELSRHLEVAGDPFLHDQAVQIFDRAERRRVERLCPLAAVAANERRNALSDARANQACAAARGARANASGLDDDDTRTGTAAEEVKRCGETGEASADYRHVSVRAAGGKTRMRWPSRVGPQRAARLHD